MTDKFERVAVLGGGVIGASWTALFLAAGLEVDVETTSAQRDRLITAMLRATSDIRNSTK